MRLVDEAKSSNFCVHAQFLREIVASSLCLRTSATVHGAVHAIRVNILLLFIYFYVVEAVVLVCVFVY